MTENTKPRPRCLDAALEYEKRGFSVILLQGIRSDGLCTCGKPGCYAAGKHPIGDWKKFQTQRQTAEELIAAFERRPDANVGIVTGQVSDLVVVDVDGAEGFESLCRLLGTDMPDLPTVKTGKGYHFYGRHPGEKLKNFAKAYPGLDGRADGGYVVAPPSRHASGHQYDWKKPPISPLPELPPKFLNLFSACDEEPSQPRARPNQARESTDRSDRVLTVYNGRVPMKLKQAAAEELEKQCGYVANAQIGQQELTLSKAGLKIGNYVGAGLLDFDHALQVLVAAGLQMQNERGRERWFRSDIAKKVEQKVRVGIESPKWGPDPRGEDEDGSPPLDIFGDAEVSDPPKFPVAALPDVLNRFVVDRAECKSACKKDPGWGVIGIQKGPP